VVAAYAALGQEWARCVDQFLCNAGGGGTSVAAAVEPMSDGVKDGPVQLAARGETILLVEDDPGVQEACAGMLGQIGYTIIRANNGKAALEILSRVSGISLLVTDVIMKDGMNGKELAQKARERWPGIKVLFCSSHAENAFSRKAPLERGAFFIRKPYDRHKLAATVRKILES
jgi:DNA-binding NtrC family response regulator